MFIRRFSTFPWLVINHIFMVGHWSYYHDLSSIKLCHGSLMICKWLIILTQFFFNSFDRYICTRKDMIMLYKISSVYKIKISYDYYNCTFEVCFFFWSRIIIFLYTFSFKYFQEKVDLHIYFYRGDTLWVKSRAKRSEEEDQRKSDKGLPKRLNQTDIKINIYWSKMMHECCPKNQNGWFETSSIDIYIE